MGNILSFKNVRGLVILFVNKIMDKLFVQNNSNSSSPRHGELIFLCAWFFMAHTCISKYAKCIGINLCDVFTSVPFSFSTILPKPLTIDSLKSSLNVSMRKNLPCSVHHGSMDPFLQNVVLLINFCKVS